MDQAKGYEISSEKKVVVKFEKRKKVDDPQQMLHNSRIQVWESVIHFGLVTDKRFSWG